MSRARHVPTGKEAAIKESHQSINDQVLAFLSAGGKIQQVPLGATGQIGISTKKYTIENKHKKVKKQLH